MQIYINLNILNLEQKMFHLEQILFQPLLDLAEVIFILFLTFFYVF